MYHKIMLAEAFPIGVKYCQHRDMGEKYWDIDFQNMRDCGIDAINDVEFVFVISHSKNNENPIITLSVKGDGQVSEIMNDIFIQYVIEDNQLTDNRGIQPAGG